MRQVILGGAAIVALALAAWGTGPAALERGAQAAGGVGATCCDLYVFEPAGGLEEGYALEFRAARPPIAVLKGGGPAGPGWRLATHAAAREALRRWRAASRKPGADSILIIATQADFHLGAEPPPPGDPEIADGDTLVLIRGASWAQARRFVDEIPGLEPDVKASLREATDPPR